MPLIKFFNLFRAHTVSFLKEKNMSQERSKGNPISLLNNMKSLNSREADDNRRITRIIQAYL